MSSIRNPLALAALLFATGLAQAQTATSAPLTPSQQYAADSKQLEARYQSDLAMCNSEKESAGRMQCKRDAKTEYDKALASAKADPALHPDDGVVAAFEAAIDATAAYFNAIESLRDTFETLDALKSPLTGKTYTDADVLIADLLRG